MVCYLLIWVNESKANSCCSKDSPTEKHTELRTASPASKPISLSSRYMFHLKRTSWQESATGPALQIILRYYSFFLPSQAPQKNNLCFDCSRMPILAPRCPNQWSSWKSTLVQDPEHEKPQTVAWDFGQADRPPSEQLSHSAQKWCPCLPGTSQSRKSGKTWIYIYI